VNFELIIKVRPQEIRIALLEDKKLVELHTEKRSSTFAVGDLFFGKVKRMASDLNAVFVDIGLERDAFLHYHDLGPSFPSLNEYSLKSLKGQYQKLENFTLLPSMDKHGKIDDVLQVGSSVILQMLKEPISSKGARLSGEITLAGRYVVLMPFGKDISVSSKIKDDKERNRLRNIVKGLVPKNYGVIIRTVAKGVKTQVIQEDLKQLIANWEKAFSSVRNKKKPEKILAELEQYSILLRDSLNDNYTSIYVDDEHVRDEVLSYLDQIAPDKKNLVKLYQDPLDIFEHLGVSKQIRGAFGRYVPLPNGAYLVVEHTEAMHVIDVNTGGKKSLGPDLIYQTNLNAAKEVARVLRLRDMGGLVVVDFIDMHSPEKNKALHHFLTDCMKPDKAQHKVLTPSSFGLIEITRQRTKPETDIRTAEHCPECSDKGEIPASILLANKIESLLDDVLAKHEGRRLLLTLHPFIYSYFKHNNAQWHWLWKYKKWVTLMQDHGFYLSRYLFQELSGTRIELEKPDE
jgi:ribonuclease G